MNAKIPIAIAIALAISVSLAGCASNKGGDTSCKSFRSMSSSDQKAVITKFINDEGDADPSPAKVTGELLSAKAFCLLHGGDTTISGIDG